MIHESVVDVRVDHAAERGAPFPAARERELNLGAEEPAERGGFSPRGSPASSGRAVFVRCNEA